VDRLDNDSFKFWYSNIYYLVVCLIFNASKHMDFETTMAFTLASVVVVVFIIAFIDSLD